MRTDSGFAAQSSLPAGAAFAKLAVCPISSAPAKTMGKERTT